MGSFLNACLRSLLAPVLFAALLPAEAQEQHGNNARPVSP